MKIQLAGFCESPTLIWQVVLKLCRPLWVTSLHRQEVHTSDKGIKIIIVTHSAQKPGFNPTVGQPRECKFVQSFLRHFGSLESLWNVHILWPATLPVGKYVEIIEQAHKDLGTVTFVIIMLTITNNWKQPKQTAMRNHAMHMALHGTMFTHCRGYCYHCMFNAMERWLSL